MFLDGSHKVKPPGFGAPSSFLHPKFWSTALLPVLCSPSAAKHCVWRKWNDDDNGEIKLNEPKSSFVSTGGWKPAADSLGFYPISSNKSLDSWGAHVVAATRWCKLLMVLVVRLLQYSFWQFLLINDKYVIARQSGLYISGSVPNLAGQAGCEIDQLPVHKESGI